MKKTTKLCVIPARGGSKRLIRKNVLPLAGKPLVAHAIESAQKAEIFDKILLSTDDPEIASVGKEYGVEIYNRPEEFASDTIGVIPALRELVTTLDLKGEKYDIVCQILPTCLFRKTEHMKEALKMLDKKTDAVIGVSAFDFPLSKALKKTEGEYMKPNFDNSPLYTGTARAQDQEVFYHDNGAFYFAWWDFFKKHGNFYKGKMKGYEIHPLNAVDIDDKIDFAKAQALLDYMKKDPETLSEWLSHIS